MKLPDPLLGTWKLNVAKSKAAGPYKPVKELTVVYEEQDGQLVVSERGTIEDRSPYLRSLLSPVPAALFISPKVPLNIQ